MVKEFSTAKLNWAEERRKLENEITELKNRLRVVESDLNIKITELKSS